MSTAREMANMIFLWDDAVTEIANVVIEGHSAEVTGYVAENILDRDRQTCFKTSATGNDVYISVDLLTDQTIKAFGLHNHDADTRDASYFNIKYGSNADGNGNANNLVSISVSSIVGDDDFFYYPASSVTARYVRYEFDSVDTANLYLGRMFLARQAYDYSNGLRLGAQKGGISPVDILETKCGTEHRILRGSRRKRLLATIPNNSGIATDRTNLVNLMEHVEGNYKAFVHSWPYGTTMYSGNNRYGMAVHARWANPEWLYPMLVAGGADLPIDTIEDK